MHHLSNAISSIKVGVINKRIEVDVPNTKVIVNVLKILGELGYIRGFTIKNKKNILVFLKYFKKTPVIRNISVVSTPGRRVFIQKKEILIGMNKKEAGFYIISTNKGLLTDEISSAFNVGGEVMVRVN